MAITLLCPNLKCGAVLAVPDDTRGKKVRCKYCGTTFMVPHTRKIPKKKKPEKEAEVVKPG